MKLRGKKREQLIFFKEIGRKRKKRNRKKIKMRTNLGEINLAQKEGPRSLNYT